MPAHQVAPMPRPGMPQHPHMVQPADSDASYAERARARRSRKPNDKNLPEGVEACIIDPDVALRYRELRELERRLDATMTRKRLDIIESVGRESKRFRTMRVWISNTVEDQHWQGNDLSMDAFDLSPSMDASYRVKIEGRLLDDADEDGVSVPDDKHDAAAAPNTKQARCRFSHLFKQMNVEFETSQNKRSADQAVAWTKPDGGKGPQSAQATAADFDELTFKRNGDENMNIVINLVRHEDPERYQLSPALAEVIDASHATRQEATLALWDYIRLMGLQDEEDKRNFRCDDALKRVTQVDVGSLPNLAAYIESHLGPLPPVSLAYTVRVDEEFHTNPQPTVYDIQVAVDDPLRAKLLEMINNPTYGQSLREIRELDGDLATLVMAISSSKAKHSFFTSLGDDPVTYLRNWLSSQKRDLEVIMGEAPRGGGEDAASSEWRKGGPDGVWGSSNAHESVQVMLSKGPLAR